MRTTAMIDGIKMSRTSLFSDVFLVDLIRRSERISDWLFVNVQFFSSSFLCSSVGSSSCFSFSLDPRDWLSKHFSSVESIRFERQIVANTRIQLHWLTETDDGWVNWEFNELNANLLKTIESPILILLYWTSLLFSPWTTYFEQRFLLKTSFTWVRNCVERDCQLDRLFSTNRSLDVKKKCNLEAREYLMQK